ncbi:uncharacterized protein E0L32_005163 [Thyridium curvatum]|uniref:MYND-type domain-containing protein n=1 Tax=Thyridium curvatum TaxID=1093900 RepID=A0A507BDE1_9PEZI|nr:uncharacterized protein E0L32_005163 [Thyridium curvatum]TPX14768.1 hypothetical protein E0L32_005163 [Thyridium curvatum]
MAAAMGPCLRCGDITPNLCFVCDNEFFCQERCAGLSTEDHKSRCHSDREDLETSAHELVYYATHFANFSIPYNGPMEFYSDFRVAVMRECGEESNLYDTIRFVCEEKRDSEENIRDETMASPELIDRWRKNKVLGTKLAGIFTLIPVPTNGVHPLSSPYDMRLLALRHWVEMNYAFLNGKSDLYWILMPMDTEGTEEDYGTQLEAKQRFICRKQGYPV